MVSGTRSRSVLVLDPKVLLGELKGEFQHYTVRAAIRIPHQRYPNVLIGEGKQSLRSVCGEAPKLEVQLSLYAIAPMRVTLLCSC
jgi:hypothetical protein